MSLQVAGRRSGARVNTRVGKGASTLARTRRATQQLALPLPLTWGGARFGAGRKPAPGRSPTPHRALPAHEPCHPVHVTLRSSFRPLRSQHVFPTLRLALARATQRDPARFRILHFSVQYDHVHLVVEAADKAALSSGVRSIAIRIARYVNDLVQRRGRFWADRWFGRELTSPRQVRNALAYVLANFRKHARRAQPEGIDPFSSGGSFDGFRGWQPCPGERPPWSGRAPPPFPRELRRDEDAAGMAGTAGEDAPCEKGTESIVLRPRTWLARIGWRRHGLIALDEGPS